MGYSKEYVCWSSRIAISLVHFGGILLHWWHSFGTLGQAILRSYTGESVLEALEGPLGQVAGGISLLGIGGWAIHNFIRFKDAALARAEADKLAALRMINEAEQKLGAKADLIKEQARGDKAEVMAKLGECSLAIERVNMALSGYDGQGGLLEKIREIQNETQRDREQRHALGNAVMKQQEILLRIAEGLNK